METRTSRWTLAEVADLLGGVAVGPADLPLDRPVTSDSQDPRGIAFAQDAKYLAEAESGALGAILVPPGLECKKPHIVIGHPRIAFVKLLHAVDEPLPLPQDIHTTAIVDPTAKIGKNARIGPYAVVEANATVGEDARVYPHAYIGENCHVGARTQVLPHAVLVRNVRIGADCLIQSGAVLGADGFGYFWDGSKHAKIPQVGSVEIGDNCEIGALSAVDRATVGTTQLAEGIKLDNFVQVAHNVKIGSHTVIASLCGLGGSAVLGSRVVMAGQAAVGDHKRVGDNVVLGGRAGAAQDVLEPGEYLGFPARPIREAQRAIMLQAKLPEILNRLRALERAAKAGQAAKEEQD